MSRPTDIYSVARLVLLLVLATGSQGSASYVPCKLGNYSQQMRQRAKRINIGNEVFEDNSRCCDASSWVVDEENGTLGVYFQVPSNPEKDVKILILEKWESGKWIAYTMAKMLLDDSERLSGETTPNTTLFPEPVTSKCGFHTFEYISSGRYRLHSCKPPSVERHVNTSFDDSNLNCDSKHTVQATPEGAAINVRFSYEQQTTQKMDRIYRLKDANGTAILEWSVRARKEDNDNLTCEMSDSDRRVSYEPVFDAANHAQNFMIVKLLPGNYFIEVTSHGQLSYANTKLNVCRRVDMVYINGTTQLPSRKPIEQPQLQENITEIFMVVLAAVVVLCSLFYVVHVIRKYCSYPRPKELPPKEEPLDLARKKILLLYARDCAQFNNVMAAFRNLLKDNNFEVYDCYDPVHRRQVDKSPTLWMRCLVEDSSVRVVVVSSKCARLQQLALMNGYNYSYKEPHYLDRLFIYGLCDAMSIYRNIYQKIFSVKLEGFTQNEDILTILSGSRIYSLPSHLLELFRDLKYNSKIPEETAELGHQVLALKEKLDILVRHADTERDYLRTMIVTY